jgi:hypothetical protein
MEITPNEILVHIAGFMDNVSLHNFAVVSHTMLNAAATQPEYEYSHRLDIRFLSKKINVVVMKCHYKHKSIPQLFQQSQ